MSLCHFEMIPSALYRPLHQCAVRFSIARRFGASTTGIRATLVLAIALFPLALMACAQDLAINEIRVNEIGNPGNDYFEIAGTPGTPLDDYTYIVLGDNGAGNSGVIEAAFSLNGRSVPDDGYFLAAGSLFGSPGTPFAGIFPDFSLSSQFTSSSNRTHMLVEGFFGNLFDDLDLNDSGVLDQEPWGSVVDAVGIVEDPNTSEPGVPQLYALPFGGSNVGPTSRGGIPAHLFRVPDIDGDWAIGDIRLNPVVFDTPGSANQATDVEFNCEFADALIAAIVGGENDPTYDVDMDGDVDRSDFDRWRVLAGEVLNPNGQPIGVGDANLDGAVDGEDFLIWNDHKFTLQPAWCAGDFNIDGAVDGQDFFLWNRFRFTGAATLSVPEPSSAALGAFLLVCWAVYRGPSTLAVSQVP